MASQKAAQRSLQHLMRLHSFNLKVSKLLALLDQEQGPHHPAKAELTTWFKGLRPGRSLEICLLLADLVGQGGSDQVEIKLYKELAEEDANDARLRLALALLWQ